VKLWHAPARLLPVVTRPIRGETIPSYARRLSAANDLPPGTIVRALGQLTRTGPGKHLLMRDARLNEQAAGRLEAYTGIPRDRLSRALPALRGQLHPSQVLPQDRPALCFQRAHPRPACRQCNLAASGPSGPEALVLAGWTPLVCRRHRRWLGPDHEPGQYDLSAARDILTAERRLAGLLARGDDRAWAWREFRMAWNMAQDWTGFDPRLRRMPVFTRRWRDRAAVLGITVTGKQPPGIVTFPEAVTLATILTDLNWRRHVALEWDTQPFYQRVAESIGEQSYPSWPYSTDPVRRWVRFHRARFGQLRAWSWGKPPSPAERFK
jgi:hypothetical protein